MGEAHPFPFTFLCSLFSSVFYCICIHFSQSHRSPASSPFKLKCHPRWRYFLTGVSDFFFRIMGRKAGTLFINPKRFGSLHKPCMKEMALFLNCMAANQSDVEACARQKELLNACMESQSKKNRKSWGSINYQLQRLSRGRK